jgi:hypothetical protein
MKFFSNEAAKDNPDYDEDREHAKHAAAEPAAVPQQRGGSPWSDAPGNPDALDPSRANDSSRTDDASRADDSLRADDPSRTDSLRSDDPSRTDDSLRADDFSRTRDDSDLTAPDHRDNGDEPYRDLDGPATETSTTTTYGPDGTVTSTETDKLVGEPVAGDAVKDDGSFDSPKAVEPATGEPLDGDTLDGDKVDGEKDDKYNKFDNSVDDLDLDLERSDDPAKADSSLVSADDKTDDKVETTDTTPIVTEPTAGVAAVPATIPATPAPAATPTPVATPAPTDRIFADGDSFTDRFREVQLKFVDNPKEATDEAATLVTEVIDKLSETLKGQQKALAGDSDDTEKLRVELRGYRDILNRLLAL